MLRTLRLRHVLFIFSMLILVRAGHAVRTNPLAHLLHRRGGLSVVESSAIAQVRESEPGFKLTKEDLSKFHIWPMGNIPYFIDDFSFDKVLRDRIRFYLERVNSMTGLRFMELMRPPDDNEERWVLFINRRGHLNCSDYPFSYYTNTGVQSIVLGYNCLNAGRQLPPIILSLVGIPPQHNSPDRSHVIKVDVGNVLPGKEHFFDQLPANMWLFHDVPYDLQSAGHYSPHQYTRNGIATLKPIQNVTNSEVGDRIDFSPSDIWKIIMLYAQIRRNKTNEGKITGCQKLFNLGHDIDNYEPQSEDEIAPRPKPAAYLGELSETVQDPNSSGDGNSSGEKSGPEESKSGEKSYSEQRKSGEWSDPKERESGKKSGLEERASVEKSGPKERESGETSCLEQRLSREKTGLDESKRISEANG